ncbi:MAG TPA: MFS transporter [Nocardioidaceae bacterium]|nr:MFS transporter [Nocardioidaceae bacterium]
MSLRGWVGSTAAGLARGWYGGMRWPDHKVAQVQRRTLGTLVVSQASGGLGNTLGIAVAALLAERLSGSEKLAGLAQTTQVLGAAVAAYALARLMGRRGRRPGLALGYGIGGSGAVLCVLAGVLGSFPLLLFGSGLFGAASAANSQSRYAAIDLAVPARRARALATVVWATTVGAVVGPNLVGVAGRFAVSVGLPRLTGPFAFAVLALALGAAVVAVLLRPDPLLVAREAARTHQEPVTTATSTSWSRVAASVRERPGVAAGMAALALGHAVMVAIMVMTPLHMRHGGATLQVIGLVVSVHVLGMYALSPAVGWAADRFGRPRLLGAGAGVLLLALALAGSSPMGTSWQIGVGLFCLGLGWSMCTVTASTLLSESAPLSARTDVQGAADLVMGLTAAAAGALGGVIVGFLGFAALNVFAAVLVAGIATAAEFARRARGPRLPDDVEPLAF